MIIQIIGSMLLYPENIFKALPVYSLVFLYYLLRLSVQGKEESTVADDGFRTNHLKIHQSHHRRSLKPFNEGYFLEFIEFVFQISDMFLRHQILTQMNT